MEMGPEQLAGLVRFAKAGVWMLSSRILIILAMLFAAGLAGYAMLEPTQLRVAMATLFAVIVYVPTLIRERTKEKSNADVA